MVIFYSYVKSPGGNRFGPIHKFFEIQNQNPAWLWVTTNCGCHDDAIVLKYITISLTLIVNHHRSWPRMIDLSGHPFLTSPQIDQRPLRVSQAEGPLGELPNHYISGYLLKNEHQQNIFSLYVIYDVNVPILSVLIVLIVQYFFVHVFHGPSFASSLISGLHQLFRTLKGHQLRPAPTFVACQMRPAIQTVNSTG